MIPSCSLPPASIWLELLSRRTGYCLSKERAMIHGLQVCGLVSVFTWHMLPTLVRYQHQAIKIATEDGWDKVVFNLPTWSAQSAQSNVDLRPS